MNNVEESRSVQDAPTLMVSEKGAGLLNASSNALLSYPPAKVDTSYYDEDDYDNNEWVNRVQGGRGLSLTEISSCFNWMG